MSTKFEAQKVYSKAYVDAVIKKAQSMSEEEKNKLYPSSIPTYPCAGNEPTPLSQQEVVDCKAKGFAGGFISLALAIGIALSFTMPYIKIDLWSGNAVFIPCLVGLFIVLYMVFKSEAEK